MQYLKKEVRERIIQSAATEFKENGYSDASIRNIAENAGISLGNIYRYFENKETLYYAVINPFLEDLKKAVETDFVFRGKTMKEISETLVAFLVKYSDELLIVRRGNPSHYESFVHYIVDVIATKIHEMLENAFPEIYEKISNPEFYNAVAEGFFTSLFKVLKDSDPREVQERNCRELITFYFGHMKDRYYHFDVV